jgi:hypothetical protein
MKKFTISVLSIVMFFPHMSNASLSFTNATSDRVIVNAATPINTLSTFTLLAWVYLTSVTDSRVIVRKGTNVSAGWFTILSGAGGNIRLRVARATTASDFITNDTPLAVPNKWYLVAFTFNTGAGQVGNIYTGDLTTSASLRTLGTNTNGSGAVSSDSAVNLGIGNVPSASAAAAFPGKIAYVALINRELSLGEIRSWQFRPRFIPGTVGFWKLGYNGTNSQTDYSGKANSGTVTGATVSSHVPILSW